MAKIKEHVYICKSVGKTVGLLNNTVAFEFESGLKTETLFAPKERAHEVEIDRTYTKTELQNLKNKMNEKARKH